MKHPLSFLGGLLTGMLFMYYLDAQSGGRRRALVRDKLVSAGHDIEDFAEAKSRRAIDRVKGMAATRSLDRTTRSEPESDQQLHDRIRARLGRTVGHPKAVHVSVEQGCVALRGHVLRKDVDPLVSELRGMPGVTEVRNELQVHDSAEGIPELQGSTEPPGREEPSGVLSH
jgi:osmotically-inducible protein OsmY